MTKSITVQSVLSGRLSTYRMLARLYEREMDEEYLAELKKMRCPINTGNEHIDKGYKLFHSYLSHVWERSLEELQRDYMTVFIGANTTGHAAAYPNESVHTSPDRLVMQDSRDEVLAIYNAAGFKNSENWTAGEDHIALELEFMARMAERAAQASAKGENEKAATYLMTSHHFLCDHLLAWVPELSRDMQKFAQTDFYCALAELTLGFIEEDKDFLEEALKDELEAEKTGIEGEASGDGVAPADTESLQQDAPVDVVA